MGSAITTSCAPEMEWCAARVSTAISKCSRGVKYLPVAAGAPRRPRTGRTLAFHWQNSITREWYVHPHVGDKGQIYPTMPRDHWNIRAERYDEAIFNSPRFYHRVTQNTQKQFSRFHGGWVANNGDPGIWHNNGDVLNACHCCAPLTRTYARCKPAGA